MTRIRTAACALACSLSLILTGTLAGCGGTTRERAPSGSSSTALGTLGGAALGGLVGSQFGKGGGNVAATVAGVVLGGLAGRELGKSLADDNDRDRAAQAERDAVERDRSVTWSNPDTGRRGTVEPVRSYTDSAGRRCRDYIHTVETPDGRQSDHATACRDEDGNWRVIS
jgi:surface antigen